MAVAYQGKDETFRFTDRGFLQFMEGTEVLLVQDATVSVAMSTDDRISLRFVNVTAGRDSGDGGWVDVRAISDGLIEGTVAKSCRAYVPIYDEDGVHNADGTPNLELRPDPEWDSPFCAQYR